MTRDPIAPARFPEPSPAERLAALLGDGLDGVPVTPEEEAEARLTAHALGELPRDEAELAERALAEADTAARQRVEETRSLAAALRSGEASPADPRRPVGMAAIRTAVTAALATRANSSTVPADRAGARRAGGVFARGPLAAVPMLLAAGGTAAAILALIVTQEQSRPGVREDLNARDRAVAAATARTVPVPSVAEPVPALAADAAPPSGDGRGDEAEPVAGIAAARRVNLGGDASAVTSEVPPVEASAAADGPGEELAAKASALPVEPLPMVAAAAEAPSAAAPAVSAQSDAPLLAAAASEARPDAPSDAPPTEPVPMAAGDVPPPAAVAAALPATADAAAAPAAVAAPLDVSAGAIARKRFDGEDAEVARSSDIAAGSGGLGGGGGGPPGLAMRLQGQPAAAPGAAGPGARGVAPPPMEGRSTFAARGGQAAPAPADALADAGQAEAFKRRFAIPPDDEKKLAETDRRWFQERDADRLELNRAAPGTERYARFVENPFRTPRDQPLSTFSIDVDTASYSLVRRFLNDRRLPPPDAVRLEEMLNYFRYDDAPPAGDEPFSVSLETAACPWRDGHRLVRVGLKGRDVAPAARPGTSLVFLVDVSGSMNEPDKLPLVKQSLSMLVEQLTENDRVSIVAYAGDAGLRLAPTSGDQKERIRGAIDALVAGGSTNGSAGIELAYAQAAEGFIAGGSNRVILATDGDLNVGVTSDAALVDLIRGKAAGGVFLTVLGFGKGNLQDEKMEKIADNGNGIYAYIDGAREARKVLVEQLTGSTLAIAKDVKIQVEFNPAQVAAWRLLGYENRLMAPQDFRDDRKDAGEIGAGHGVTALYEIVPTAAAARSPVIAEPLKYQPQAEPEVKPAPPVVGPVSSELLTLKLRWKEPAGDTSTLREFPLEDAGGSFENASANLRFAAAVAEFGMLLRSSEHRGRASLAHVTATAAGALGADPGGLRAEFLDLVREAGALVPHVTRPVPN